jgi:hypothetical protein
MLLARYDTSICLVFCRMRQSVVTFVSHGRRADFAITKGKSLHARSFVEGFMRPGFLSPHPRKKVCFAKLTKLNRTAEAMSPGQDELTAGFPMLVLRTSGNEVKSGGDTPVLGRTPLIV